MTLPDCECCGEVPGTIYLAVLGHVCTECMIQLGRAHLELSNPALRLAGCAEKPDREWTPMDANL